MPGFEDMVRSIAPDGNIGKPLLVALGALLASGALFRGGGAGQTAGAGPQQTSAEGVGGVLGGLGGLLNTLEQKGLGNVVNYWVGSGQNQSVSPGQLGSALGPNIIKMLAQKSGLSEEELTKQLSQVLPGLVDKMTPNGRVPNSGGVVSTEVTTRFGGSPARQSRFASGGNFATTRYPVLHRCGLGISASKVIAPRRSRPSNALHERGVHLVA
jgi:uncharacterized protein YidB (DUF937 family)